MFDGNNVTTTDTLAQSSTLNNEVLESSSKAATIVSASINVTKTTPRPLLSPLGFVPYTITPTNTSSSSFITANVTPATTLGKIPQPREATINADTITCDNSTTGKVVVNSIPLPGAEKTLYQPRTLHGTNAMAVYSMQQQQQYNHTIMPSSHPTSTLAQPIKPASRISSPAPPSTMVNHAPSLQPLTGIGRGCGSVIRDHLSATTISALSPANPFASSQQGSIYVAPPLKKDTAPAPFGARGRMTFNSGATPMMNMIPVVPSLSSASIQIIPHHAAVSTVPSILLQKPSTTIPSMNQGYRISHIDRISDDHDSGMITSHSSIHPHMPPIAQQRHQPPVILSSPIKSEDLDVESWIKKQTKPEEETLGQILGLKRLTENFNGIEDRKKRKATDIPVINAEALDFIPDGIQERFLGHVLYTGASISIVENNNNNIKQFLLPPFSDKDYYATIDVRIPAKYLSIKDNIAVANTAVWGTDVYTDDSDVVAMAIHSGFFRPHDFIVNHEQQIDASGNDTNDSCSKGLTVKAENIVNNDQTNSVKDNNNADSSNDRIQGVGSTETSNLADLNSNKNVDPNNSDHHREEEKRRKISCLPCKPTQGELNPKTHSPAHDITVTLRVLPRLKHYYPSTRHGITSRGWGSSHDGESLRVEAIRVEKDRPSFDSSGRKEGAKQWSMFARSIALEMMSLDSDSNGPDCYDSTDYHSADEGWQTEFSLGGGVTVVFSPLSCVACLKYAPKLLLDWPPHLRDFFAAIQNPIYGQLVSLDESADSFSRAEVRQGGLEEWPYFRMKLNRGDVLCLENGDCESPYHYESYEMGLEPSGKVLFKGTFTRPFKRMRNYKDLEWDNIIWDSETLIIRQADDEQRWPISRFYWKTK